MLTCYTNAAQIGELRDQLTDGFTSRKSACARKLARCFLATCGKTHTRSRAIDFRRGECAAGSIPRRTFYERHHCVSGASYSYDTYRCLSPVSLVHSYGTKAPRCRYIMHPLSRNRHRALRLRLRRVTTSTISKFHEAFRRKRLTAVLSHNILPSALRL